MNGADFVAVVRLTNKDASVVTNPGETCERVDPKSLPWLEEGGLIKRAPRRPAKAPASKLEE